MPGAADARLRALVLDHFDFVWRLLRRLGVPAAEVDDAAQQVLIVASKRLSSIPTGSERAFLYGTSIRTAKTLRRDLQRRRKWLETSPADCASPDRTPQEELERRQSLAFLDSILLALEDELREVFVLCEIEELTAVEVADIVGIPAGTVASRLRRARADFSSRLKRARAQRLRNR